ncbi:MAG: hypothetical protein ACLGH4_06450 [Actinomycetes bacterium]
MGNVNLPTPVALAGGALCALGGYLLGVVAGPDTVERTTAVVESFDASTNDLCLSGDGVEGQEGVVDDGVLCGTWRRTSGATAEPKVGDTFRFVTLSTGPGDEAPEGQRATTVIYGDVVR